MILHYHFKGDYWDFPRGKVEKNESEEETAKREIEEETGLKNIKFIKGFKETINWFYRWKGKGIYKEAVYFLAKADKKKIKLSEEHLEYVWLDYKKALDRVTYKNTKEILKKAHQFIQQNK